MHGSTQRVPLLKSRHAQPKFKAEDVDLYDQLAAAEARQYYWAYRQYMRPGMKWGWWTDEISWHYQQFLKDFIAGKQPILAIMAPPQHGKSWSVTDFASFIAGYAPNMKTIFASFSDDLGIRTNMAVQRAIQSERFRRVFPDTRIGLKGLVCNSEFMEYGTRVVQGNELITLPHAGSFRNTTVNGAINGLELNLGIIDDPVKGRKEAKSPTIRNSTWDWFADDFLSRFAEYSALVFVMTRWDIDDVLGRFIQREGTVDQGGRIRVLRYPAIAEKDEPNRKAGEPLFPELKSKVFLERRRKVLSLASWESLYQQNPIVTAGGLFDVTKLRVTNVFDRSKVIRTVRYWDKAGTDEVDNPAAAWTAGVRMHLMEDGSYVVSHVVRGHWSALKRVQWIKKWAELDSEEFPRAYYIVVEQEGGSGGKESAEATIRMLGGYSVAADRVSGKGSKVFRAEPFAAQVEIGNVYMVAGSWNIEYVDEMRSFPGGRWKDQIDASSGAFQYITAVKGYDTTYRWVT